jgi:hypothetical protein
LINREANTSRNSESGSAPVRTTFAWVSRFLSGCQKVSRPPLAQAIFVPKDTGIIDAAIDEIDAAIDAAIDASNNNANQTVGCAEIHFDYQKTTFFNRALSLV